MLKKCIVCGNEFETDKNAQKTCSKQCSIKRKSITDKNKIKGFELACKYCNKKFIGNKGTKFCSKECRSNNLKEKKKEYICTCIICGNEFNSKNSDSKYCSNVCKQKWVKNNPRHTLICKYCNNEFKTNNINQKYCSEECFSNSQKDNRVCICKNCGKEFNKRNKKSYEKNIFCSKECWLEYLRNNNKRYCCECGKELTFKQKKYCSEDCRIKHITKEYICNYCGKSFDSIYSKKYCSKKCQHEAFKNYAKENRIKKFISEKKVCKYCGKEFNTEYKKSRVYCSIECKNKMRNKLSELSKGKRANLIKENGNINNDITLKKLYKRDKGICAICGEKCSYEDYINEGDIFIAGKDYPSIDHVIPISKGGTHTWDNIQLAHMYCNTLKGNN